MDFDPSQFLAMAMSEDQDAVYSAPDLSQPVEDFDSASGPIVVEGGLQMEQDLQIPVPVFDTLGQAEGEMDFSTEDPNNDDDFQMNIPLNVEITEPTASAADQKNSPVEKSASPHIKKIVPTSYEESRFRKDFFCGNYERVKLFRLHCTICDRHLGCAPWFTERQMRTHKIFSVSVCRPCFDFFGDINFPIEDDSEIYCCWCGEGGEVFCCSKCPKIVCKKCVKRNFGEEKVNQIDKNDNWVCFVCDPTDIWPHRALFWGWQRLAREMRQNVSTLSKEERQTLLSKDSSHCCLKPPAKAPTINLPRKSVMSKIPLCMIAKPHRETVRNQPNHQTSQNSFLGSTMKALLTNGVRPGQSLILPRPPQLTPPNLHPQLMRPNQLVPRQPSTGMYQTHNSQTVQRFVPNVRTAPYPPMTQIMSYPNRLTSSTPRLIRAVNTSYPNRQAVLQQTTICSEVIDVDDDSPPRSNPNKQSYDIAWLERGVYEIKGALASINSMTDQILANKDLLKYDMTKAADLSVKLTNSVKQAIITMAKINEDISSGRRDALQNQANPIMKDVARSVIAVGTQLVKTKPASEQTANRSMPTQVVRRPEPALNGVNLAPKSVVKQSPRKVPPPPPQPKTPEPTAVEEDVGEIDVNPALLCETVMHVEGNKENNDGNKSTAAQSTPQKNQSVKKGRPRGSYMKITARKSFPTNIPVIVNLVDDTDNDDNLCKKFKIRPCKVVVKKLPNIKP